MADRTPPPPSSERPEDGDRPSRTALAESLSTELSTLNRVSHRLAMTDAGPALQRVLGALLPRLLRRVGKNDDAGKDHRRRGNARKRKSDDDDDAIIRERIDGTHDAIHKKLIEMLVHAMKRVREDRGCKLPCLAILETLVPPENEGEEAADAATTANNPFTINLGLAFLTLGINRCAAAECSSLLPALLKFLGRNLDRTGDGEAIAVGAAAGAGRARADQAQHLVLRCLESISRGAGGDAASAGAAAPVPAVAPPEDGSAAAGPAVASLRDAKRVVGADPVLAAALFDLLTDVFLYSPVPASSTVVPSGLSTVGYQRLCGGAASEKSPGCKNWKEEFSTRGGLRRLKLDLLNLIAPCRRHALFLPERSNPVRGKSGKSGDGANGADVSSENTEGSTEEGDDGPVHGASDSAGVTRTVALMVLLAGDPDPDVKGRAESYLRAHMDTYRGKEVPQASGTGGTAAEATVHDALLGNSVALAQTILSWSVGGAASAGVGRGLASQYGTGTAVAILRSRLGLTYRTENNGVGQQKALLSCYRTKIPQAYAASTLKFVGRMLDDNPKLFRVEVDTNTDMDTNTEEEESDVAAVSIGTLVLAVVADSHRPGSSATPAMGSAASLLNSLCVRLSLFYDARLGSGSDVPRSSERVRSLLARSMARACAVLASASSGESTSPAGGDGIRASSVRIEVRDKCYGAVCALARSKFSLEGGYALFDCGKSEDRPANSNSAPSPSTAIPVSAAKLLFGCASNEVEVLKPRATSALDALLGAYVRVVQLLAEREKMLESERETAADDVVNPVNPWATISERAGEANKTHEVNEANEANGADRGVSTGGLSRSLLPLLWGASRRNRPKSSRVAAARWSGELLLRLRDSNADALHLLCFLSGDDDATVSAISKRALGVDKILGEDNVLAPDPTPSGPGGIGAGGDRATFGALMDVIVGSQSSTEDRRPRYADFHVRAQAATLRFLLNSLFGEESFYGDEDSGPALGEYVRTILRTLASHDDRQSTREVTDLVDECSIALASCTSTSGEARLVVVGRGGVASGPYCGHDDIATKALKSKSSKTRRHLAEAMRHLYEDRPLWGVDSSTRSPSVSAWIESSSLANTAKGCRERLAAMSESSFAVGEVHGAALLGSSCVRAFRLAIAEESDDEEHSSISDCWEHCCGIVSSLGKGLAHPDITIGNACSKGIVTAFSYNGPDAPVLSRELFDAVAIVLDEMRLSLKKFSSIDHADPARASSLVRAAGLLLAASTSGAGFARGAAPGGGGPVDLGPARLRCAEALLGILGSAAYGKDDELSLVVGEALVRYADASGAGEWSAGSDTEWKEGPYDEAYAFGLPPHRHVLYAVFRRELASSNPMKRNSCAATLLALMGHASRTANTNPSSVKRAFVQEMWKRLGLFQSSFIKLLADPKSKQLSRESCCKGLAACRGLASVMTSSVEANGESQSQVESLNEQLLKAFGQTTNYGQSAMMESETQATERRNEGEGNNGAAGQETQVGGAAGMSEASLGAYREMASTAISLGQIDVLYSLMILSTNHPMWLTSEMRDRYSARALLGKAEGASVEEIRVGLRPHMGALIPKLLRACNDPSKQTRDNMNNLWLALTGGGADSRDIVNQNLLPSIDVLIKDAGSKLWRARAGACGALADIIVGRSWQDLGGGGIELDDEGSTTNVTASIRLLRLWKIAMRGLDDIRTAVRERGEALGRGIRALTIRLCDPTVTDTPQESDVYLSNAQRKRREKKSQMSAEYAATVSLGWLVKYGLNQSCSEAAGICVSCLLGIVDVAKPSTLQPVLAELVGSLLMAMSGLEPAALNYLQVRAAGNDSNSQVTSGPDQYDRLERLRINLALSGPIAGALHKCLEMVQFVDLEAQKKLIPELDSSLRKGAGFATRAATADAVGNLCGTCPAAFSFPGSSMSNPTVRLLRALYFASERERGVTAKDKMTHALGSLAELAPGNAVRILALKACERYCESSGSNNDPSIRKAAAATIRAIAVRASIHLADGGPKDIWCKKVLPTSFLGRHDKDAKVSSLWKDVWEEGGLAISSMDRRDGVFGVLLQEKLLPFIVKSTISALQSTSWANRRAGCAVLIELTDANILAPTPRSTGESNTISDEEINRLRQRANASSTLLSECLKIISRNRIWEGKGEVVKAGTTIAGKWSASAPMNGKATGLSEKCKWPLVLQMDSMDDLFSDDSWIKLSEGKLSDKNDDVGSGDANNTADETDGQKSKDETALDLSEEIDLGDNELLTEENAESGDEGYFETQPVVFSGFCRVLLGQALRTGSNDATEGVLPYKASALSGLAALLKSIVPAKDSKYYVETVEHQSSIYDLIAPSLFSFVGENQPINRKSVPPLLIARALECLASAMYDGVGADAGGAECADAARLLKFFALSTGTKQPAWTVRQMSALAASSLVANMSSEILKKTEVITTVLECSTQTLKDKKFWKVRLSGLQLLLSLVRRVGNQKMSNVDSEKQLIMEAILPYKERIIDLSRKSLADHESQVTAAASEITLAMAWWP